MELETVSLVSKMMENEKLKQIQSKEIQMLTILGQAKRNTIYGVSCIEGGVSREMGTLGQADTDSCILLSVPTTIPALPHYHTIPLLSQHFTLLISY